jgi:hypothetical protein
VLNPTTNYEATGVLVQTLFRESDSFSACFASHASNSSGLSPWWSWSFAAQALPSCASFGLTRWVYAVSEAALAGLVLDQPYSLGFSMLASVGQTSIAQLQTESGVLSLQTTYFTSLDACLATNTTTSTSADELGLAGTDATLCFAVCVSLQQQQQHFSRPSAVQ